MPLAVLRLELHAAEGYKLPALLTCLAWYTACDCVACFPHLPHPLRRMLCTKQVLDELGEGAHRVAVADQGGRLVCMVAQWDALTLLLASCGVLVEG